MLALALTLTPLLLSPLLVLVHADPTPSEPAPGEVFNAGTKCNIEWDPDTTGEWTTMFIELMTGSNQDMVHLTTVTSIDATKQSSYQWDCPSVSPPAPIYFYQFSSPASPSTLWTGRFTIASSSGATTSPTETTDGIQWGTGTLDDPSSAVGPPDLSSSAAPASASASSSSSSAAAQSTTSSPSASAVPTTTTKSASPPSTTTSAKPSSGIGNTSGAARATTSGSSAASTQAASSSDDSLTSSAAASFGVKGAKSALALGVTGLVFGLWF